MCLTSMDGCFQSVQAHAPGVVSGHKLGPRCRTDECPFQPPESEFGSHHYASPLARRGQEFFKRNVIDRKPYPEDENLVEVKFATTPVMSTYLVAFVIGEYDFVESQSSDGITVRVYTPVGKAEQGKFALEVATKTLPFYKDYFDVPYPLPKIDLIAIADFAAGAMENWGLVTYR
uniref:Peptidase M1 membrane alanine aminopeptidase domain-containing protein n=1 Tax=Knipowitschia caucasica TaxID=637954 RepID=A0AAV2J9B0_KNICA